jgi:hypothetical protein
MIAPIEFEMKDAEGSCPMCNARACLGKQPDAPAPTREPGCRLRAGTHLSAIPRASLASKCHHDRTEASECAACSRSTRSSSSRCPPRWRRRARCIAVRRGSTPTCFRPPRHKPGSARRSATPSGSPRRAILPATSTSTTTAARCTGEMDRSKPGCRSFDRRCRGTTREAHERRTCGASVIRRSNARAGGSLLVRPTSSTRATTRSSETPAFEMSSFRCRKRSPRRWSGSFAPGWSEPAVGHKGSRVRPRTSRLRTSTDDCCSWPALSRDGPHRHVVDPAGRSRLRCRRRDSGGL